MDRFSSFWQSYRLIIKALIIFGLAITAFTGLLAVPPIAELSNHEFAGLIAAMSVPILNLLGISASVDGSVILTDSFAAEIITACTPIYPSILLIAAMLAFPSSLKYKLLGLIAGLPGLLLLNQVRIVNLIYIGKYYPQLLDMAHYLVWQSFIMLAAIGLWLFWVRQVIRCEYE